MAGHDGVLIYGATGYTGRLFAERYVARGGRPVLAARSGDVGVVADELGCEARVFDVSEAAAFLENIEVLVNVAGPFAGTQGPLIEGCLAAGAHYLDITGEVAEVESAWAYDHRARGAGIKVVPASGFGVVPTDIAAALAVAALPEAVSLVIAYATEGGASRGTLQTVLRDITEPGVVVRDGRARTASPAMKTLAFEVMGETFRGVYNPWRGDLVTARRSTGVPSIETYSTFPAIVVRMMRGGLGWLRRLLLGRVIGWLPAGPSEKQRARGRTRILAVARTAAGDEARVEVAGPEAYEFTVECLARMIELVQGDRNAPGVRTPSSFGTDWLAELDGVEVRTTRRR